MRRGSAKPVNERAYHQPSQLPTGQAYHPISFRYGANTLFRLRPRAVSPGVQVLLGDFGEFCVHLRGLGVIVSNGLIAVGSETIFVERVDLYWVPDVVRGTEIC